MEEMLEVREVCKNFGGLAALSHVSFKITEGKMFGLIGPNGSGKTTLFNVISGVYPLTSGRVLFNGENITGKALHETADKGIVRTFQGTEIFKDLSVLENVKSSGYSRLKAGLLGKVYRSHLRKEQEDILEMESNEILKFVGISEWRHTISKNLPLGFQRLLGVAIALSAKPKLLMLDEPTTGMNPAEKQSFMKLMEKIRENGTTIALVEHDMKVMMGAADWIVVLSYGEKIAEGIPEEIRENKKVIEVYLGAEIGDT